MRAILTDLFSVVRELSLDALAGEAVQPPSLLLTGDAAVREHIGRTLFGPAVQPYLTMTDGIPSQSSLRFDLVMVLWTGRNPEIFRHVIATARRRGWPLLALATLAEPPPAGAVSTGELVVLSLDSPAALEQTRQRLIAAADEDRWLALGRHLRELRPAVAASLVHQTARVNAQFAALAGLATLVPLLGTVLAVGGDFLVLTKNQLVLIFKLAAVYGRALDDRRAIYLEMVPVVGTAFLWRTIARELIGLLPGLLGLAPRIAVAFTGTVVVGTAARYYYEVGRAPSRDEWRRFYAQASHWLGNLSRGQPGPTAVPPGAPAAIPREWPGSASDSAMVH